MHEENRQLEDFLAKILEKEDFPFDEKDWENVVAQLDGEESKKGKRLVLLFWLCAAAIALLFTTFMLGRWWGISGKLKQYENRIAQPYDEVQPNQRDRPAEVPVDSILEAPWDSSTKRTLAAEYVSDHRDTNKEKKQEVVSIRPGPDKRIEWENATGPLTGKLDSMHYQAFMLTASGADPPDTIEYIEWQSQPVANPTKSKHNWSLSLVAAPDYSATRLVGRESVSGYTLGALVAYKINFLPGLNLVSGVKYSQKNYLALRSDYIAPKGFWKYKIVPQTIDADCRILDIPLLFRYVPFSRKQDAFFMSGGVSSFFMLNEAYAYNYEVPSDKLINNFVVINENQYLLNGLNFSIGYKVPVRNKMRLSIEPYLYLPLRRIGHGNVNLYSYGVQFGVEGSRMFSGFKKSSAIK